MIAAGPDSEASDIEASEQNSSATKITKPQRWLDILKICWQNASLTNFAGGAGKRMCVYAVDRTFSNPIFFPLKIIVSSLAASYGRELAKSVVSQAQQDGSDFVLPYINGEKITALLAEIQAQTNENPEIQVEQTDERALTQKFADGVKYLRDETSKAVQDVTVNDGIVAISGTVTSITVNGTMLFILGPLGMIAIPLTMCAEGCINNFVKSLARWWGEQQLGTASQAPLVFTLHHLEKQLTCQFVPQNPNISDLNRKYEFLKQETETIADMEFTALVPEEEYIGQGKYFTQEEWRGMIQDDYKREHLPKVSIPAAPEKQQIGCMSTLIYYDYQSQTNLANSDKNTEVDSKEQPQCRPAKN